MTTPLKPAELVWDDFGCVSAQFGDRYGTRAGAYAQAQAVFLQGAGLPEAFQAPSHRTLLELGFGFGSNFLVTLAAFLEHAHPKATLDYVAVEAHPVSAADAARYHQSFAHPELKQQLLAQWPVPLLGIHSLSFAGGRVRLLLVYQEVGQALAELRLNAQHVYLDGFAPRVNPEMWSHATLHALRRQLVRGAQLSSYAVTGQLKRDLSTLGFEVETLQGFGGKRERLQAQLRHGRTRSEPMAVKRIAVIGAGIAGTAAALELSAQGYSVTRFGVESAQQPYVLVHPEAFHADDVDANLKSHAFLAMERCLMAHGFRDQLTRIGVDKIKAEGSEHEPIEGLLAARGDRWHCASAGYFEPQRLLTAMRERAGFACIEQRVESITSSAAAISVRTATLVEDFDVVVLALGAHEPPQCSWNRLALHLVRGQSELLSVQHALMHAEAWPATGYVLPIGRHQILLGASYLPRDHGLEARESERLAQRQRMHHVLERHQLAQSLPGSLHTGIRATGPDRRPLIGPWPNPKAGFDAHGWPRTEARVYSTMGMGSRGFTMAFLAALVVSAQISGRVVPLFERWRRTLDPGRFVARGKAAN
jgi:tRNA 5-methylaminomethyl-2-thiouridine biosynthesis bifunctional protein